MKATDVPAYNSIALGIHAPVYAHYAGRILEKTGISSGSCLDVGCGGGYLGLSLAQITELNFLFMDKSPEMISHAVENILAQRLSDRASTVLAEVQAIPLSDASIDLVISRGSVPFWSELSQAFSEIRRILKPHGKAYIGGGLGPPELRDELREQVHTLHPEWQRRGHVIPHRDNSEYRQALQAAGLERFSITRSDEGMWIEFGKW